MRLRLGLLSTAAISLMLAMPAFAQQPRPANPNTATLSTASPNAARELDRADMNFVKEAAIGGMAEVEMGKVAEQNAQDPQVKEFGNRMVRDHSDANTKLTTIANGKNVQLPKELDQKHAQMRDKLARLKGAQFDREYMREVVKDHEKDVKEFDRMSRDARDSDVRAFAARWFARRPLGWLRRAAQNLRPIRSSATSMRMPYIERSASSRRSASCISASGWIPISRTGFGPATA